ncbi:hypothetical protein MKX03_018796 [Papaver bracteatum]|nr:hypothetical protein MKX03_018796 [Papaver bracteatum]
MCLKFSILTDLAFFSVEQSKVVNVWLGNRIEDLKAKSIELENIKINAKDQGDPSAPSFRDPAKNKQATRGRGTHGRGTRGRGTRGTGTLGRDRATHRYTNAPKVRNNASSFLLLACTCMFLPKHHISTLLV